jgi:DNA-binding FadR family transcriptional regulator
MQLIEKLNVSRGVVREAYRSLAALGILEIESGKRPRTKQCDATVLERFFGYAMVSAQISPQDILNLRRSIELGCIEQAALNGTEEDFAAMHAEMALLEENFHDPKKFLEHDVKLHLLFAKASKNALYILLLEALHGLLEVSMQAGRHAQQQAGQDTEIIALHKKVVELVTQRDAEAAVKAMAMHFDTAVSAILEQGLRSKS